MQMRQVGSLVQTGPLVFENRTCKWRRDMLQTRARVAGCGPQKAEDLVSSAFILPSPGNLLRTIRRVNRPPTTCSAGPLGAASGSHDLRLALNRDS